MIKTDSNRIVVIDSLNDLAIVEENEILFIFPKAKNKILSTKAKCQRRRRKLHLEMNQNKDSQQQQQEFIDSKAAVKADAKDYLRPLKYF